MARTYVCEKVDHSTKPLTHTVRAVEHANVIVFALQESPKQNNLLAK